MNKILTDNNNDGVIEWRMVPSAMLTQILAELK